MRDVRVRGGLGSCVCAAEGVDTLPVEFFRILYLGGFNES